MVGGGVGPGELEVAEGDGLERVARSGRGIRPCPCARCELGEALPGDGGDDIGSGLMLLVVLARADRRIAGGAALAAATMPLGDMIVVLTRGGSPRVALGVHGTTCLVMAAAAGTLLSGDRPADRS